MGSYEREMALAEAGKAQRGKTALDYFAELDAKLDEEASHLSHRPDYGKTLFAPEHDDIYREFWQQGRRFVWYNGSSRYGDERKNWWYCG